MPLYEYECTACGHRFEQIQKFSDPAVDTCPACGGAVQKLMSSAAIQFKGSGWYITDYARKSQSADNGNKPGEEAKETKPGDKAKSDGSTVRDTSSPPSDSASSSSPATSSTGSSSSES